jgi:hypothetical protein
MRAWSRIATAAAAASLSTVVTATTVNAAEVVLMATGAIEQIIRDLVPSFEGGGWQPAVRSRTQQ